MPNIPCERVAHPSAGMSDRSAVENAGTARLRRRYCPCRAAFKPAETVTSEIRHQCLSMNGGGKRAGGAGELPGPARYCSVSVGSTVERRPAGEVEADRGRFRLEEQVAGSVITPDDR